jgi:hypothetical protein
VLREKIRKGSEFQSPYSFGCTIHEEGRVVHSYCWKAALGGGVKTAFRAADSGRVLEGYNLKPAVFIYSLYIWE